MYLTFFTSYNLYWINKLWTSVKTYLSRDEFAQTLSFHPVYCIWERREKKQLQDKTAVSILIAHSTAKFFSEWKSTSNRRLMFYFCLPLSIEHGTPDMTCLTIERWWKERKDGVWIRYAFISITVKLWQIALKVALVRVISHLESIKRAPKLWKTW